MTAKKLKDNLIFDGITVESDKFEKIFASWLQNRVSEDWSKNFVTMTEENGDDPWIMTTEEYNKL